MHNRSKNLIIFCCLIFGYLPVSPAMPFGREPGTNANNRLRITRNIPTITLPLTWQQNLANTVYRKLFNQTIYSTNTLNVADIIAAAQNPEIPSSLPEIAFCLALRNRVDADKAQDVQKLSAYLRATSTYVDPAALQICDDYVALYNRAENVHNAELEAKIESHRATILALNDKLEFTGEIPTDR